MGSASLAGLRIGYRPVIVCDLLGDFGMLVGMSILCYRDLLRCGLWSSREKKKG